MTEIWMPNILWKLFDRLGRLFGMPEAKYNRQFSFGEIPPLLKFLLTPFIILGNIILQLIGRATFDEMKLIDDLLQDEYVKGMTEDEQESFIETMALQERYGIYAECESESGEDEERIYEFTNLRIYEFTNLRIGFLNFYGGNRLC